MKRYYLIAAVSISLASPSAFAHFPIFLHDAPFGQPCEKINILYAVGHPYEREYEDAEKPKFVVAVLPTGKRTELTDKMKEEVRTVRDRKYKVWTVDYQPTKEGEAALALNSAVSYGPNKRAYQEFIKTFVHATTTKGWRQRIGQPLEMTPLTRPYGIQEGSVFSAQVRNGSKPAAMTEVKIERYMDTPPDLDALPPEPLITRVVVTDSNGAFTCTLPKAGWWIMAASVEDVANVMKDGEIYKLDGLAAIWVHVEK